MVGRQRGPASWATTLLLVALSLLASGVWVGRWPQHANGVNAEDVERVEVQGDGDGHGHGHAHGHGHRGLEAEPHPPAAALPSPAPESYRCRVPDVAIERTPGCDEGLPYPACKWRLPAPHRVGRTYRVWRNTVEEHLWARPALVAVMLATAAEYARQYPGEELAIGDMDAPGPRHETHDNGVDVDLYLPGMMEVENLGGGEYAENYRGLDGLQRRMIRGRVETLARILATCTQGRLRIYYNDDAVRRRFLDWFSEDGFVSPFGRPMQGHNDLHRFHFHVTVPEDLPMPAPEGSTT